MRRRGELRRPARRPHQRLDRDPRGHGGSAAGLARPHRRRARRGRLPRGPRRHDRRRRDPRVPRATATAPSAASSRSSAAPTTSASTSRSSSASTTCPTASRRRCSSRPPRLDAAIPADELARRRDFRASGHRHHRRRNRARLRRRRLGGPPPQRQLRARTSTSPTSATTCAPARPSTCEAALRGTSVYFPDRAVPMLPLELSTEICSLKPQVDRLVLSVLLEIDHRGDVVSPGVHPRRHPQRRADDLHQRAPAARRRRRPARALRPPRRRVSS